MIRLAARNLARRPLRSGLAVFGLAISVAVLASLLSFGEGYTRSLRAELDRMGLQMMLVPLGCPYDAAARALKGRGLDSSLPEDALLIARRDPAVAVAAPMYAAAIARPADGRTDLWVGIDEASRSLKPWWRLTPGSSWFRGENSVILGAEAAATELRNPGDRFYSPETGREFVVSGVLERSGTSDDSLFFVPLHTAQAMFRQPGRLTAVAIRLKDPALVTDASDRLQQVKGAQVVTLAEMMGTFLNLVGAGRTLVAAIAIVALAVSVLGVFNTMMAALMERTYELGVMRAVGLSRIGAFSLMAVESLTLAGAGGVAGLVLAALFGRGIERAVKPFIPLAPEAGLPALSLGATITCLALTMAAGLIAGLYPALRASRLSPAEALRTE